MDEGRPEAQMHYTRLEVGCAGTRPWLREEGAFLKPYNLSHCLALSLASSVCLPVGWAGLGMDHRACPHPRRTARCDLDGRRCTVPLAGWWKYPAAQLQPEGSLLRLHAVQCFRYSTCGSMRALGTSASQPTTPATGSNGGTTLKCDPPSSLLPFVSCRRKHHLTPFSVHRSIYDCEQRYCEHCRIGVYQSCCSVVRRSIALVRQHIIDEARVLTAVRLPSRMWSWSSSWARTMCPSTPSSSPLCCWPPSSRGRR